MDSLDTTGVTPLRPALPTRALDPLAPAAGTTAPDGERRAVAVYEGGAGREAWCAGLEAEGLILRRVDAPDAPSPQTPPVHAVLWWVSRSLTERLTGLRQARRQWAGQPLLVVCEAARELDHVLAFEVGADDVLDAAWPASVVAARLRAQWRTAQRWRQDHPEPEELRFGRLALRWRDRSATLAGERVALTDGEFDVLWSLAIRAGEAVTRVDLLRRIRGTRDPVPDRSIDSRVYRIRLKLGDIDRAAPRIRGVRNCGYLFSPLGW